MKPKIKDKQYSTPTKSTFSLQYNVEALRHTAGGGGEYEVQEGFGWTNGVVLDLLLKYGDRLKAPLVPPSVLMKP